LARGSGRGPVDRGGEPTTVVMTLLTKMVRPTNGRRLGLTSLKRRAAAARSAACPTASLPAALPSAAAA
jgi:hypothetical protein